MKDLTCVGACFSMLVLAAGCGSQDPAGRCAVAGNVTYDGQPIDDGGGIAFIPEGPDPAQPRYRATGRIEGGEYSLDKRRGPNVGKYRVQITWLKKTGKKVPGEGGHLVAETQQVIPAKYNENSELLVDIQPGSNHIPFELKK